MLPLRWWPPCRSRWTCRIQTATAWRPAARNERDPSPESRSSDRVSEEQLHRDRRRTNIRSSGNNLTCIAGLLLRNNTHLDVWWRSWAPAWCSELQDRGQRTWATNKPEQQTICWIIISCSWRELTVLSQSVAARDSVSVSDHHRVSAQIVFVRVGESQSGAEEQIQQLLNIRKDPNNHRHQACENWKKCISQFNSPKLHNSVMMQCREEWICKTSGRKLYFMYF